MTTTENPEAAFIAKITASTTHEVRNVLAIVKESAGLIADMIQSAGKRGPLNEERLLRAVGRIDAQVGRGADILTNLNRFAHCLDHPQERIDLHKGVQQVALLCERFARLKRHVVEVQRGDEKLEVMANALHLQMVLFDAVECCLEALSDPGTVTLRVCRYEDRPAVELTGRVGDDASRAVVLGTGAWVDVNRLAESVGAAVATPDGKDRVLIVFGDSEGG